MRVVLPGGSGFLGHALHARLRPAGHEVVVLTRRAAADASRVHWDPNGGVGEWARVIDGADAVINLAGENIADARWTATRKKALRESRTLSTRSVVAAIRQASKPPTVLVNASGIGYYGPRGAETVTEAADAGNDFLAAVCVAWESEAVKAASHTRVAIVRNGLVLHPSGGALSRMLLPFRLGLGGKLGPGEQYLPWIHLEDWLDLVTSIINTREASGPFNATSPQPITNAAFTRALGKALHRPTIVPVPAFGLRLVLGELADTLLTGQRAIPARAQEMGFRFRFADIVAALRDLLKPAV